jgi:hypothetical protein
LIDVDDSSNVVVTTILFASHNKEISFWDNTATLWAYASRENLNKQRAG